MRDMQFSKYNCNLLHELTLNANIYKNILVTYMPIKERKTHNIAICAIEVEYPNYQQEAYRTLATLEQLTLCK